MSVGKVFIKPSELFIKRFEFACMTILCISYCSIMDIQVRPVPDRPKTFQFPQRTYSVKSQNKEVFSGCGLTVGRGYIIMNRKIVRFVISVCWTTGRKVVLLKLRLTSLMGIVTQLKSRLTSLMGIVTQLKSRLASLMGIVTQLKSRLTSLMGIVTQLKSWLTSLMGIVTQLKSRLTSLMGIVTQLKSRLTSLMGIVTGKMCVYLLENSNFQSATRSLC